MRTLPFALLLIAAVLVTYGPGLHAPLAFDDHDAITANPTIRSLWTALSPPPQTPVAGRPLANLSFALCYALTGLRPSSYHSLGFLLHLLNALLALWLVRTLLARPVVPQALRARATGVAQATALLWLVHPLPSEAVMYVTQRTEQLAATFYLLTLLFAVRAMQSVRGATSATLAVAACALGTLCKETIVSAPLAVLLIDRGFFATDGRLAGKTRRALYLGLYASWLVLALVLASAPRGQTAGLGLGIGPLQSLATQGSVIAHYLRLSLLPYPLSISYDWPLAEPLHRFLLQDAVVALLFAAGALLCFRRAWAALPWLVFFGVLAPSSSIVPVLGELAAERRMYLPLLALLALLTGACAFVLFTRLGARAATLAGSALVAALAIACGAATASRVRDYRSERVQFEHTLRHQPDNPIAMWGLGDALAKEGDRASALALYERMAQGVRPYHGPFSWGTRGLLAAARLHARAGERALSQATLRRAFEHDPDSAVGQLYRAATLRRAGKLREALALVSAVLEGPHLHAEAHVLAANLYRELGAEARAREHSELAAQLDDSGAALALVRQLVALR